MQFRAKQIAPPKEWGTFEDLCHALFKRVWKDPLAQKNGRRGQEQHGVDIFGSLNGDRASYQGVQCKGKDRNFGSKAKLSEIVSEIAKAEEFTPTLERWIFATTAPVDGPLQKAARELSADRKSKGLFVIDVLGWDEIQALMAEHPEVIEEFYPEHAKPTPGGRGMGEGFMGTGGPVGIQFANQVRIGTFVQGLDAATVTQLTDALDRFSKTLPPRIEDPAQESPNVEDPLLQAARHKARSMSEAGDFVAASQAFADALEREERLEGQRRQVRAQFRMQLLEDAVSCDLRVPNAEAALARLRLIAELVHPDDFEAQKKYLAGRAHDYKSLGAVQGDNATLIVAVSVFAWLAEGMTNAKA